MDSVSDRAATVQADGSAKPHTRAASTSLSGSSTASLSDPGSIAVTAQPVREEKVCPDGAWYYLYLPAKELRTMIAYLTGEQEVKVRINGGTTDYRRYTFRVFCYTDAALRRRFERCAYTEADFDRRQQAYDTAVEALQNGTAEAFARLARPEEVVGSGYLFVNGPLETIEEALEVIQPRHYLARRRDTRQPATIADSEMRAFIYLYEAMPYQVELLAHPLEEYSLKHQKIRITSGIFAGREGRIMRLHRSKKLVLSLGEMTVAISNLKGFAFEVME